MRTNVPIQEEANMPPKMDDEQINHYIKKSREQDMKTWDEIAQGLVKQGAISAKTKKALSPMAVRFRYYNETGAQQAAANGQAERQLDMIRKFLALPKAEDKVKIQLIQSVLEES
jgi:hypothetical protein